MSVYIKGMEMPTKCCECLLAKLSPTGESLICNYMLSRVSWDERPFDCPLVPVPPHGRLIDESKVLDIVSEWCPDDDGSVGKVGDLREMLDEIEALPPIIPAEEGEI